MSDARAPTNAEPTISRTTSASAHFRPFSLWEWAGIALFAVVAAAGVWLLRHHDPNLPHSGLPSCLFFDVTGFYCPGCGITRALHAVVHGDLARAFGMNPLAMIVIPLIPLMLLHARGFRPRVLEPLMRIALEPNVWVFSIPAYWIARNLPWWPFAWMAPG